MTVNKIEIEVQSLQTQAATTCNNAVQLDCGRAGKNGFYELLFHDLQELQEGSSVLQFITLSHVRHINIQIAHSKKKYSNFWIVDGAL